MTEIHEDITEIYEIFEYDTNMDGRFSRDELPLDQLTSVIDANKFFLLAEDGLLSRSQLASFVLIYAALEI